MFNLGAPEIIVLLIIALLVFGPDRLPEIGANLGRSIRDFRKMSSEMTDGLTSEVQEVVQTVQDVTKEVQDVTKEITSSVQEVQSTVTGEVAGLSQMLNSTGAEVQSTLSSAMNPVATATAVPVSGTAPAYVPPVGTEQREYIPSPRLFGHVGPGAASPARQSGLVGPGAAFGLPAIVRPEPVVEDALASGAPEAVTEETAADQVAQPAVDLQASALPGMELATAEPAPEAVVPETGAPVADAAATEPVAPESVALEVDAPSAPQTTQLVERVLAADQTADTVIPEATERPVMTFDDDHAPMALAFPATEAALPAAVSETAVSDPAPAVDSTTEVSAPATTPVIAGDAEAPDVAAQPGEPPVSEATVPTVAGDAEALDVVVQPAEAPVSEATVPTVSGEAEAPDVAVQPGESPVSEATVPPDSQATSAATPTADAIPVPKPRHMRRPDAEPDTAPVIEVAPIVENETAS